MEDHRIIRHDRLGFTETDVLECTDRDVLLNWQIEVAKDLQFLNTKIEGLRQGLHDAESWDALKRTQKFRSLMAILHQRINIRVSQLRKEKKKDNVAEHNAIVADINYYFRVVAQEVLTGKQYTEIIKEAKVRLAQDKPDIADKL